VLAHSSTLFLRVLVDRPALKNVTLVYKFLFPYKLHTAFDLLFHQVGVLYHYRQGRVLDRCCASFDLFETEGRIFLFPCYAIFGVSS
jgi:hypothetical protein